MWTTRVFAAAYGYDGRKERKRTMPKTDKFFLCQVQNCPNEKDVPADDKLEYQNSLRKVFGDDLNVVNCERVENKAGQTLFCEMMIKSDHADRSLCPDGFKIILEIEE